MCRRTKVNIAQMRKIRIKSQRYMYKYIYISCKYIRRAKREKLVLKSSDDFFISCRLQFKRVDSWNIKLGSSFPYFSSLWSVLWILRDAQPSSWRVEINKSNAMIKRATCQRTLNNHAGRRGGGGGRALPLFQSCS